MENKIYDFSILRELRKREDLNIAEWVDIHSEFVPNTEVVNYFCAASVVVQPYKTATQSGITQVAYHFERPIITTNVGGLAEIVINNRDGFVVEPNAKQIADAINTFYEKDLESEFESNVRVDKKRFSWDKLLSAIDKVVS